jgi:hypothetical protein
MVIEDAILEWEQEHSWQLKSQIEQDLIICRALCALYDCRFGNVNDIMFSPVFLEVKSRCYRISK